MTIQEIPKPDKPYKEWTEKERLDYHIQVLECQLSEQGYSSNASRTSDLFTLRVVLNAAKKFQQHE